MYLTLLHQTEVDDKINKLINKTKGNYITQGVSFNINCPRQMNLLRLALTDSNSFSGLVKEMLALRYSGEERQLKSKPIKISERNETKIDKSNAMAWV